MDSHLAPAELEAERRTVLITGATTGLGLEILRLLLEQQSMPTSRFASRSQNSRRLRIIATGRQSSLARLAALGIAENDRLLIRALDVTDPEQRKAVVDEAVERFGGIDILINNAGVAYRSVAEDVEAHERLAQMNINFLAPMALARLVLPAMRERAWGRIINVSSVGGMMAMPTMSAYSASKFALEGASEALWYEVRPWNVRVSLVEPGFISSDSFERTRYTAASSAAQADPAAPYHAHYKHMTGFISRLMKATPYTSRMVARKIVALIDRQSPPLRVPATFDAHLFGLLRRWLPRRLYHALLYRSLPGIRSWGPQHSQEVEAAGDKLAELSPGAGVGH